MTGRGVSTFRRGADALPFAFSVTFVPGVAIPFVPAGMRKVPLTANAAGAGDAEVFRQDPPS